MASNDARRLTAQELEVLHDVRCFWGTQNSVADVFFSDRDEAALFVKARDGGCQLCVVLTNLGQWRADGTLSTWDYRRQIMGPVCHGRSSIWVWMAYVSSRLRASILGWSRDT